MISYICGLKKIYNQLMNKKKKEADSRYREQTRGYQSREERGDRKCRGREIRGTSCFV